MKRFLLAALGAVALVSLNGCYAEVAPYSYGTVYTTPTYYATPVYTPAYVAPPVYRGRSVYVAPPRAGTYRTAVVAPRYGHRW